MRRILTSASIALVLSLTGWGCSSTQVNENDPESLYKEAQTDISNDHYQIAIDKLRALRSRFPYSKFALEAQLTIADVYYKQESYTEAAGAYEAFRDLHPKHEKVSYAMFRAAKSYFMDAPTTVARDLTPAVRALDSYQEYLRRFPQGPEVEEARKDVATIRGMLADKELGVGLFYVNNLQPDSARSRLKKVIELYPESAAAKTSQEVLAKLPPEGNAKP